MKIMEQYEWSRSWADEAPNRDLPRVLLVGDSITEGYQGYVREALKGKVYVDFWATSYGVDRDIYHQLLKGYLNDSHYDLVHFSHGLHAKHLTKEEYEAGMNQAMSEIQCKTILALVTQVYEEGLAKIDESWQSVIEERNGVIKKIAQDQDLKINDLYTLSTALTGDLRSPDGVHYMPEGFRQLGKQVAEKILFELNG